MAQGRTVSANLLTNKDKKIFELVKNISDLLINNIKNIDKKLEFKNDYAKLSFTRDAGAGRGGGALQRDGLCTRGKTDKSPLSNRNLRWHPLISAHSKPSYANEIKEILIKNKGSNQILNFIIEDTNGKNKSYNADEVYLLEKRYVVLPKHWSKHIGELKKWDSNLWSKNQCIIPASESCEWYDAVESYAVLGLCQSVAFFEASKEEIYESILDLLKNQKVDSEVSLPSSKFPKLTNEIFICPLCNLNVEKNLSLFRKIKRTQNWQPEWRTSKKTEGEDSSLQLMHIKPLNEVEMLHNAQYARYGHRWCNISMTDHTIEETVAFMEHIVKNNFIKNSL
jgi:hypothetical protein